MRRLRTLLLRTALAGTVLLLAAAVAAPPLPALKEFAAVRADYASSEARLLDRNGVPLHELRVDRQRRRLQWTAVESISPAALAAIVRAEDKRFYRHRGVDWIGTAAAMWSNAGDGDIRRGASTITMQLVAQMYGGLRAGDARRSIRQKWAQMRTARALERQWSKAQILEAYLNLISFRGELQGIAAASNGLFDKQPGGITQPEAVVLAALIRAPNADALTLARRACALSGVMSREAIAMGDADPDPDCRAETQLAHALAGHAPRIRQSVAFAPHVARQLLTRDVAEVRSSLDADLQRHASASLRQQLLQLQGEGVRDGAVLVVDNASGEVLAYVGNAGTNPKANYVDGVRAMRQAGSTLKPFLYGLAIDAQRLTAASLLDDSPVNLDTPTGLYVPQNYDKEFRGWVSVRTALGSSLNVPTVRTLMLVGVDSFTDTLRRLGFEGISESGDYYGYSLALGSAEVSLWQLVNGYRTLANLGRAAPLSLKPQSPPRMTPVLGEAAAYIVGDMLADRGARATTFGLDNAIALPFRAAVKTGTSKDMRDNWCVGYSQRYTVGVWVGNFDGEPMHDVSGVTGAAPVWAELMHYLHRGQRDMPSPSPAAVVRTQVSFLPAVEPAREELFVRGTAMTQIELNSGRARPPRITYPGNGMVIAVDPDIPPERQRVFFEMQPVSAGARWQLNGSPVAEADGWRPTRGSFALQLVDGRGDVLDSVQFVVRGH
jgi:penicillin-binding protein 1C